MHLQMKGWVVGNADGRSLADAENSLSCLTKAIRKKAFDHLQSFLKCRG